MHSVLRMPEVAVVIGNFQGAHFIEECLQSLDRQTLRPREIVVIDAGSTDGGDALARDLGATVIAESNRGIGSLYNRGAAETTAPFVLFLNNDVSLDEHCLGRLVAALDAHPDAFAADPRQRDWPDAKDIHRRTTLGRGPLLRQPLPGFAIDQNTAADRITTTVMANGAAMLVRRERFEELGGFDETFFMEWEDIDLSWRAWLSGWPTIYVPNAWLRHYVRAATTGQLVSRRSRSSHHNLMRFALKCFPSRKAGRVIAGELLRLPAHPILVGQAAARIASELPEILEARRRLPPTAAGFAAATGQTTR
jgi:GT2 family glycosyltransferase